MRGRRLTALPGAFRYPAFRRVEVTGALIVFRAKYARLPAGAGGRRHFNAKTPRLSLFLYAPD